jgi:hypothetical protein
MKISIPLPLLMIWLEVETGFPFTDLFFILTVFFIFAWKIYSWRFNKEDIWGGSPRWQRH